MSETMRERVVRAILCGDEPTDMTEAVIALEQADAAITAVIEALAAEAEREDWFIAKETGMQQFETISDLADWLRAHLDAGRDGEAAT